MQRECKDQDICSDDAKYVRREFVGKGSFKVVYKAYNEEEGLEVAWNEVTLAPTVEGQRVKQEVALLQQLNNKRIISIHDAWEDVGRRKLVFITELMTSGTLREFINNQRSQTVRPRILKNFCVQILEGLAYLHGMNIIHRDLKCDNIFLNGTRGEVKIGDFGLSISKVKTYAESVIGTPEFMAPELYEEKYTESVDIYSFGMCVLEMGTGEYPYSECQNVGQVFRKVTLGIKPKVLERVPEDMNTFILQCLQPVETRQSALELLDDPFLRIEELVRQDTSSSFGATLEHSCELVDAPHAPPIPAEVAAQLVPIQTANSTASGENSSVASFTSSQELNDLSEPNPPEADVQPSFLDGLPPKSPSPIEIMKVDPIVSQPLQPAVHLPSSPVVISPSPTVVQPIASHVPDRSVLSDAQRAMSASPTSPLSPANSQTKPGSQCSTTSKPSQLAGPPTASPPAKAKPKAVTRVPLSPSEARSEEIGETQKWQENIVTPDVSLQSLSKQNLDLNVGKKGLLALEKKLMIPKQQETDKKIHQARQNALTEEESEKQERSKASSKVDQNRVNRLMDKLVSLKLEEDKEKKDYARKRAQILDNLDALQKEKHLLLATQSPVASPAHAPSPQPLASEPSTATAPRPRVGIAQTAPVPLTVSKPACQSATAGKIVAGRIAPPPTVVKKVADSPPKDGRKASTETQPEEDLIRIPSASAEQMRRDELKRQALERLNNLTSNAVDHLDQLAQGLQKSVSTGAVPSMRPPAL